jgi:hypothetical protein
VASSRKKWSPGTDLNCSELGWVCRRLNNCLCVTQRSPLDSRPLGGVPGASQKRPTDSFESGKDCLIQKTAVDHGDVLANFSKRGWRRTRSCFPAIRTSKERSLNSITSSAGFHCTSVPARTPGKGMFHLRVVARSANSSRAMPAPNNCSCAQLLKQ